MAQSQDDPLIGKRLAGYQILKELGRGGMGVVYEAQHIGLDRLCALKLLSPQLAADPDFVKRFLREARSAAKIEHPNIVMIYNVGENQGRYFIEMQLIRGKPLSTILAERGPLPLMEATRIIQETAQALHFAHREGIIHRDIKPDNIMLVQKDHQPTANDLSRGIHLGSVKVTDFGLARPEVGSTQITKLGTGIGTPDYMSPEQWDGSKVDRRTDIYALGITYFHVLAGRPPFDGATTDEIKRKHKEEDIPNPSHYAPQVPESVYPIIKKATAKSPFDRYLTMAELIRDLDSLEHAMLQPRIQPPLPVQPPTQPAPAPVRPPTRPVQRRTTPRSGLTKRKRKQLLISSSLIAFGMILLFVIVLVSNSSVNTPSSESQKKKTASSSQSTTTAKVPPPVGPLDRDRDSQAPMALIPGGRYVLGNVDTPLFKAVAQTVLLTSFSIDKYEVTNERYSRFLAWMEKYDDHTSCHPEEADQDHTPYDFGIPLLKQADHPVVGIDWYDAYAFAAWAGKRLPTEDEWEVAARGQTGRRFPWGEGLPDAGGRYKMNYKPIVGGIPSPEADGFAYTAPVGSFREDVTESGCFDMAGNVSEYTSTELAPGIVALRGFSGFNATMSNEVMYPLVFQQNVTKKPITTTDLEQLKFIGFRCVKDGR